ncbi:D-threo-aldose 1-dehydrogenase [Arthrobacter stackebrandtii]|uniref:D-threo-aldose 1-dehydrogenase n=1 Tax=Arthrobacter stackebrandtii TaxID=272161 RepID=A0ABS4YTK1_9MICC|nr:D-threo-aldose 1-dehydrogenase [Arthrobacter stackebrandtii]PYH02348.1 aldo/keto reductase [Arthrobacter stackebrandtii]
MSVPELGRLGFGAAGIGNLYKAMSDDVAAATLEAGWDAGLRYFDTAPHYGLGLSERRVGAFLSTKPRDEFVISTKVGRVLDPVDNPSGARDTQGFDVPADTVRRWDPSEAGIRRSIEDSLERTGLDRIDIAFLHDPDVYDLEAGINQALPALEKLRAEGLVSAIGVGANSSDALRDCVQAADLDIIMLAGRYSLLEQPAATDLMPLCLERGVGIVNVGVYNSGLLARPVVPDDANYNYAPAPADILARAKALAACCDEFGVELPAAALQFAAAHPSVSSVVVGASKPGQIVETAQRMTADIPTEMWTAMVSRGLLDEGLFHG